jgi:hypothetical protein
VQAHRRRPARLRPRARDRPGPSGARSGPLEAKPEPASLFAIDAGGVRPFADRGHWGEIALPKISDTHPVDTDAIRRRVRSGIHGSDRYYDHGHTGGDLDEARPVLDSAWSMILANRSRDALPIPEAITAEYVEALEVLDWEEIGDYGGDLVDFFAELGMVWMEALVSMDDLTPLEKEDCGAKLDV